MKTIFKTNTIIPDWFKKGLKFKGKWIDNGNNTCTIISFCEIQNLTRVKIETEYSEWEQDGWNLEHTIWGFNNGDYVFIR